MDRDRLRVTIAGLSKTALALQRGPQLAERDRLACSVGLATRLRERSFDVDDRAFDVAVRAACRATYPQRIDRDGSGGGGDRALGDRERVLRTTDRAKGVGGGEIE